MKRTEIIEVLKSIFENAKRIHGNSDSIDYVEVAIYRAATYLSKKITEERRKYIINYLSRDEVAKMFNISLVTLNKWSKSGIIKSYRVGYRVLYDAKEIDQIAFTKYGHPIKQ